MPVMDGIALALAAGRDRPDMPIMLMTGYADQRERAHGLDALVHDVIAKPFSVDQIKERGARSAHRALTHHPLADDDRRNQKSLSSRSM